MDLFGETLKLYLKRDENKVHMSFLVSPHYVQTYYLDRNEFEDIILKAPLPGGFQRPGLFVLLKKLYLRWSFDHQGMTHQIRIERDKWLSLVEQYQTQLPLNEPLMTCIVR